MDSRRHRLAARTLVIVLALVLGGAGAVVGPAVANAQTSTAGRGRRQQPARSARRSGCPSVSLPASRAPTATRAARRTTPTGPWTCSPTMATPSTRLVPASSTSARWTPPAGPARPKRRGHGCGLTTAASSPSTPTSTGLPPGKGSSSPRPRRSGPWDIAATCSRARRTTSTSRCAAVASPVGGSTPASCGVARAPRVAPIPRPGATRPGVTSPR